MNTLEFRACVEEWLKAQAGRKANIWPKLGETQCKLSETSEAGTLFAYVTAGERAEAFSRALQELDRLRHCRSGHRVTASDERVT